MVFEVQPKLGVPIHIGGDSDWQHGVRNGEKFTDRLTYGMADPVSPAARCSG